MLVFTANDRYDNSVRSYDTVRAVAQQAEADGFDSIWLADHLLYRNPGEPTRGIWESWTVLSALAEATERVELGTLVTCNTFRNPAILAKIATTADEVSHGRIILGIGAGWNEPEYEAFGLPFEHRVGRLEEALQIIRPLLREGYVDFKGQYYQVRNCEIAPRGPRKEGPPLMVGGEGPRMLRLTAKYADLWNTGYMGSPETMVERIAWIETAGRLGATRLPLGSPPSSDSGSLTFNQTSPSSSTVLSRVRRRRLQRRCKAMRNSECSTSCFKSNLTPPKLADGWPRPYSSTAARNAGSASQGGATS